jgi:simple sugar transport system substrate-binding protein
MDKVNPKVEEAIDTLNMQDGPTRRRLLKGTGLVSATAAASALLAACSGSSGTASGSSSSAAASTVGNFPKTPPWKFWFVNHVTTNPFFVATQYGFQDAAALLGLPKPNFGGSLNSSVPQMVTYLNNAISANADGIATTVISSSGFTGPVGKAMQAGIPVISYNADGTVNSQGVPDIGTNRLCYVGQALYTSGQQLGQRIKSLVTTPSEIVIFIATPGTGNIQPRYDGAASVLKPAGYKISQIATGAATSAELPAEKAYLLAHKSSVKGAFAVDAGSTQFLAQALAGAGLSGKIPAGGFDLQPTTLSAIKAGHIDFTIDQEPYLQGFLPTLYLYLFKLSGGLLAPPNTDTGLTFVTKSTVGPYLSTPTRYEGSTTQQKLIGRSGPIQNPIATTST